MITLTGLIDGEYATKELSVQQQADAILARWLTIVCDGWVEPRHQRLVLSAGNPALISHGICPECAAKVEGL